MEQQINNDEEIVRVINCPYCNKMKRIVCPDPHRVPVKVTAVKPDDTHSSTAHRKVSAACTKCLKPYIICWYYEKLRESI